MGHLQGLLRAAHLECLRFIERNGKCPIIICTVTVWVCEAKDKVNRPSALVDRSPRDIVKHMGCLSLGIALVKGFRRKRDNGIGHLQFNQRVAEPASLDFADALGVLNEFKRIANVLIVGTDA
jgi:hypothetical protein